MDKVKIKFAGHDDFSREVFVTEKGSYVVDVNMDRNNMKLHAKADNDFYGEPDFPVKTERFEIVDSF